MGRRARGLSAPSDLAEFGGCYREEIARVATRHCAERRLLAVDPEGTPLGHGAQGLADLGRAAALAAPATRAALHGDGGGLYLLRLGAAEKLGDIHDAVPSSTDGSLSTT